MTGNSRELRAKARGPLMSGDDTEERGRGGLAEANLYTFVHTNPWSGRSFSPVLCLVKSCTDPS